MARVDPPDTMKRRRLMLDIGHAVDDYINGKRPAQQRSGGFVLLMFDKVSPADSTYLANTTRDQAIVAMEAAIAKFKAGK